MPEPVDPSVDITAVAEDEWPVIGWLWQAFRHDLAPYVQGLPYADGRYQAALLRDYPSADGAGYLAWRPHPNTGERAPIGFALVSGLTGRARSIDGFWVAPAVRGGGVGRALALDVLTRHHGPWTIGFQHANAAAGRFWRGVADTAFGQWSEIRRPVPHRPDAPADHIIESG